MARKSTNRRKFLKAAGSAAAAVSATTSTAGCLGVFGGGGGGGTLTYSRGSNTKTMDPQNTTSGEDVKVTNQIYDTLIQFEAGKTTLTEGLATNWDLSGKTTTVTLREGVTFHNGEELTADDFIATYRRFVKQDSDLYPGSDYVSAYGPFTLGSWVKNMQKDGDYKVTINLKQQYAPFLRNLAMFATSVHSKKALQEKGTDLKTDPVGTGAFELDTWDQSNNRVKLVANDDYWGDGPNVDEVVFDVISSNSSRAQSVKQGESDIVDGIGAQAYSSIKGADNASIAEKPGINVGYMAFNMANKEEFRSKKVRKAISMAIDTENIVSEIFSGIAEQASQPLPPTVQGHNDNLDPYPLDTDKAESLLSEAGYGDGFSFELATFKNPRGYNPNPTQAAQTIKSNLSEIGIDVTINKQAFDPFLSYTTAGKHDACFLGWYTDNADADNFLYALLHPQLPEGDLPSDQDWVDAWDNDDFNTLNVAAWANSDYMEKVENAQTTYDQAQRNQLYKEANKIAREESPWVFLDYAKTIRGVNDRVSNYTVASIGGPYLEQVEL